MLFLYRRVLAGSLILFILALSPFVVAQNGPGGVGNQSSNVLWLQPGRVIGLSTEDGVLNWSDQSGNNNNASQSNAVYSPSYVAAVVNGLASLGFDKSNARIRKVNFNNFPSTTITQFLLTKALKIMMAYSLTHQAQIIMIFCCLVATAYEFIAVVLATLMLPLTSTTGL